MKKITSFVLTLFMLLGGTFGLILPSVKASAESENKQYMVPGGKLIGSVNENIYYSSLEEASYVNPYNMPDYTYGYSCGVTAGVNLIAWYNRPKPVLIPNHSAGYTLFGMWIWTGQNATINNLFPVVSTLMNETSNGVTIQGYLNGLNSYAAGKNLTFNSSSLMNNGVLSQSYKTELSSGKILSIFLDGFNVTYGPSLEPGGYHHLILEQYAGAHIMTVYGWYEITYKNAQNVAVRKDSYLYVGTGLNPSNALLLINSHCTVDAVYTTHIS